MPSISEGSVLAALQLELHEQAAAFYSKVVQSGVRVYGGLCNTTARDLREDSCVAWRQTAGCVPPWDSLDRL